MEPNNNYQRDSHPMEPNNNYQRDSHPLKPVDSANRYDNTNNYLADAASSYNNNDNNNNNNRYNNNDKNNNRYNNNNNNQALSSRTFSPSIQNSQLQLSQTHEAMGAQLELYPVDMSDEGIFRCRVDFWLSPTKNTIINFTVISEYSNLITRNCEFYTIFKYNKIE